MNRQPSPEGPAVARPEMTIPDNRDLETAEISLDDSHFQTLRVLAQDGKLSQRDLASHLGLSLGRVNFIINSLIRKGLVKARRFKNSRNKLAYRYALTPKGIRAKIRVTHSFIQAKLREHEKLRADIEELKKELEGQSEAQAEDSPQ